MQAITGEEAMSRSKLIICAVGSWMAIGCTQAAPTDAPLPLPTTRLSEELFTAPGDSAPKPQTERARRLKDGQIVRVMAVVHTAEIEQARLAEYKTKNAHVSVFAGRMIGHHAQMKRQAEVLLANENIKSSRSSLSVDLARKTKSILDSLRRARGAEFDNLYAGAQVEQHQIVYDMLDEQLIADARNPLLVTHLEGVRSTIQEHLSESKTLQEAVAAAAVEPVPRPTAAVQP
jgi:predicted outer membrane protein